MKNNVKILAGALITAITATSVGMTFANNDTQTQSGFLNNTKQRVELSVEQKAEMEAMREILDKQKSGETLTEEEQTKLAEFEANKPEMGRGEGKMGRGKGRGDRGGFMNDLTNEEKTALESMTDDEKKAFFEAKRTENEAKRLAHENVIDKLLAGETLTNDEELVRADIIKQRAERKAKMQEKTQ